MKNKVYIASVISSSRFKKDEVVKFGTLDKEKADKWVMKFNNIVNNNRERIKEFMQYDEYNEFDGITPEKYLLWAEFIYYYKPIAKITEIELK